MSKKRSRPFPSRQEAAAVKRMLGRMAELKPRHRRVIYMYVQMVHEAQTGGAR